MTRVRYVVIGAPGGDQTHEIEVPGEGDLTFTAPHELWQRIVAGEVDPVVAFMQGRLKMAGDMRALYDLLPRLPLPA